LKSSSITPSNFILIGKDYVNACPMLQSRPQGLEIGLAFAGDIVISIRRQVIARIVCAAQPPHSGLDAAGYTGPNRVLVWCQAVHSCAGLQTAFPAVRTT
jgi:hypothetical protein